MVPYDMHVIFLQCLTSLGLDFTHQHTPRFIKHSVSFGEWTGCMPDIFDVIAEKVPGVFMIHL